LMIGLANKSYELFIYIHDKHQDYTRYVIIKLETV
jgi:hypothetical protein